jgi:predicted acyl esterase
VVRIEAGDGTPLAATLYLPQGDGPFATLLEALPYRMHDVTASYADSYRRFVDEGGFAVLRLDLRGTGSSGGDALDEYPDVERSDLRDVIEWIAGRPWSSGRVGMFGTSYSGFNSLHMAMEGVAHLGAVAAMYATDDRYTDDVHYMGGVLRALDLIDYPLYMVAMNALPPVPAVWHEVGRTPWVDEWRRRVETNEPWLLDWLAHPGPDPVWRRGSVRSSPGVGYDRYRCPVLLIAGWADGYRNNTFRAIEHMDDWYLLAGPWSHRDPAVARPGPNIDLDHELIRFFDQHLRGGPPACAARGRVFVRRPTPPAPDLAHHDGRWVEFDEWPLPGATTRTLTFGAGTVRAHGDVGMMAWNSCAGALPWGQPLDQRRDNASSLCHDTLVTEPGEVAGNATVRLRLRSTRPFGQVSVKLCDVAGDGTSTLVTRGMLDLGRPAPHDSGATAEWRDVEVELEATTWTLVPGRTLRLAVAGTDWPNCWPAPGAFELDVDAVVLTLPLLPPLPDGGRELVPGPGPGDDDADGVEWRHEHDVLARRTWVHTRYGGPSPGADGLHVVDHYEGHVGIDTADPSLGWARGTTTYDLTIPGHGVASTRAVLDMASDASQFTVHLTLTAAHDGAIVATREWRRSYPRDPA